MNQLSIENGNKLIAEFMGMYVAPFNGSYNFVYHSEARSKYPATWLHRLQEMKYHSSWDCLMPVIDKIVKLGYRVKTNFNPIDNSVIIQHTTNSEETLSIMYYSTAIDAVYTACVQFIQWYNTTKSNQ